MPKPGTIEACAPRTERASALCAGRRHCWTLRDFIADDEELLQTRAPKIRCQRHIRSIAPDRHDDAADARDVVSSIEGVPPSSEIGFEPAAEIHRQDKGHADIAHVSSDVTRRNVHATHEGQSEMAKVAANPATVVIAIEGGFRRIGMLIVEGDVIVHPIADGLGPGPARLDRTKQLPGDVGKLVHFAVTAGKQKRQHFVGQFFNGMLDRPGACASGKPLSSIIVSSEK